MYWVKVIPCKKCRGSGWLWWNELDDYNGPAIMSGVDDTRYTCGYCEGNKIQLNIEPYYFQ